MAEIQRNYYDPEKASNITVFTYFLHTVLFKIIIIFSRLLFQKHNLTVYPGLRTTIKFHEEGLLLAVDAIHKVFSTDTALDVMDKIRREGITDFQAKVKAVLEGRLFTTDYNKKTYRYCFFVS